MKEICMTNSTVLVTCDNDEVTEHSGTGGFFSLQNAEGFLCQVENSQYDNELERLVFLVTKKPKCLANHMQRIYYCFRKNLNEPLFAAIVDFLIVLNQQGQAISWRVVLGTKSRLKAEQFQELKTYLKNTNANANLLQGNQYSVFSKGLVGGCKMIQQLENDALENDPLVIAIDHIQYCQLDEAKTVLEDAILADPERDDLRLELCDLYKSTRDSSRFHQMLAKLTRLGVNVTDDWNQLNNYFKGQNNDG